MKTKTFKTILIIGIIAVFAIAFVRFGLPLLNKGKTTIITSSTLMKAIDIMELSTAEFRYNGIAEVYEDEARTRVSCRICYNATVKAGIDMKNVHFDVDNDNKIVTAKLPDIDIKVNILDEKPMEIIPSSKDVELDILLKYSKEDAIREATESEELIKTARKNLEATIRGLLLPILEPQGYELIFE